MNIVVDPILRLVAASYPRLFHSATPRSDSYIQPGWKALVDDLCLRLDETLTDEQAERFAVRQIKDKLGTLRFYFSFGCAAEQPYTKSPSTCTSQTARLVSGDRNAETAGKIRAAIEAAISRSNTTCSVCSQPGRMHDLSGLLSVRCDEHSSAR